MNNSTNNKVYTIKQLIDNENLIKESFPYYKDKKYRTIDPKNNKVLKEFEYTSENKINTILNNAKNAYISMKDNSNAFSLKSRLSKIKNLINSFKKNKRELSEMIVTEMGKPIEEAEGEVDKITSYAEYYLENSEEYLDPENEINKLPNFDNKENYTLLEPLGIMFDITPWNFPYAMAMRNVIPALIAGNSIIWKPAHNVPQCALLLEKCFVEAGFENYEFQTVFIESKNIENIISYKYVKFVSFTGSTEAGKKVGEVCGKHIKRCLLELGGSDPMLVLDDVDVEKAVDTACKGRLRNNGETCTSTKRIIVHDSIYTEFKKVLINKLGLNNNESANEYKVGDPMDKSNKIGPLARVDLLINLYSQISEYLSNDKNNNENYNGFDINKEVFDVSKGNYFRPIIIENIDKNDRLYKEELFGPVFALYKCSSVDEMVEIANDTMYGLSCSVLTNDTKKGESIVRRLESGMSYINSPSFSDPKIPFGGYKDSGFGRTSNQYIFKEVCNLKTVTIDKSFKNELDNSSKPIDEKKETTKSKQTENNKKLSTNAE